MSLELLLLVNLATSLYMTGLIWFVQIVHYPLFERIAPQEFALYEKEHQRLTTRVVAPAMLLELAASVLLLISRPSSAIIWVAGLLTLLVWGSTMAIQVPLHQKLAGQFELASIRALVSSNWIRTFAWSIRSLVLLWEVGKHHA
jgi:hypothetical protein